MTTEPQTGKIFGAKAAVVLGSLMLAGFAALSIVTAREKSSRTELEAFHNLTAVGEAAVVTIPDEEWKGTLIVHRDGIPLYAKRRTSFRDHSMMKAGSDDSGKIPLYRRWRKDRLEEAYFVKLGSRSFLELTDKQQEKPRPSPEPSPIPETGN